MAGIGGVPPSSPITPKIPTHQRDERQRQQQRDDDEKKKRAPEREEGDENGEGDGPHIDVTV